MLKEPEVEFSLYPHMCYLNDDLDTVKMAENYARNISTMCVSWSLASLNPFPSCGKE